MRKRRRIIRFDLPFIYLFNWNKKIGIFFFFIKENWDIGTIKKRHGMIEITQIRIRKVAFVLSMSMSMFVL